MITAKNYAAQAQRGLSWWAECAAKDYPKDASIVHGLAKSIGRAVHFVLPDEGVVLDDNLRGLIDAEFRLPYPEITVEYYVNDKKGDAYNPLLPHNPKKRIVYAAEIDGEAIRLLNVASSAGDFSAGGVLIYAANEHEGAWLPAILGMLIPRIWSQPGRDSKRVESLSATNPKSPPIAFSPIPLCPALISKALAKYDDEGQDGMQAMIHDISGEVTAVLNLCEALSCSNVDSEVVEPIDPRKNAKRIRQGKLPMYETRRLVIKVPGSRKEGGAHASQGFRQGPREHLRRGHIRKLVDGKKVWVQSCVVGSKENGVIAKSYAITT